MYNTLVDTLRDLVPCLQVKKRENTPYQITQNVSYNETSTFSRS